MNIREKICQLIIMDFRYWDICSDGTPIPFTKSNKVINNIFRNYNLGGFILFRENIENNTQIISLLRNIQNNCSTPLFFGIDQEGGRVNRIKHGTSGCGNMAIAETHDPKNTYKMSKINYLLK